MWMSHVESFWRQVINRSTSKQRKQILQKQSRENGSKLQIMWIFASEKTKKVLSKQDMQRRSVKKLVLFRRYQGNHKTTSKAERLKNDVNAFMVRAGVDDLKWKFFHKFLALFSPKVFIDRSCSKLFLLKMTNLRASCWRLGEVNVLCFALLGEICWNYTREQFL